MAGARPLSRRAEAHACISKRSLCRRDGEARPACASSSLSCEERQDRRHAIHSRDRPQRRASAFDPLQTFSLLIPYEVMTNERLKVPGLCNPWLIGVGALAWASPGHAQQSNVGVYLCETEQRAAIASVHRENSEPPKARLDDNIPTTFKMQITETGKGITKYQLVELPYDGNGRDRADWGDEYSVLHSIYVGDGNVFHAKDGPAFLAFGREPPSRSGAADLEFYHAGFEYPGGEDTQLAVRWGRCREAD